MSRRTFLAPLAEPLAPSPSPAEPLLELRDLAVRFVARRQVVNAVNGVSLAVAPGETLAIVGESGSGKSSTGLAVMGLLSHDRSCRVAGEIRLKTKDGRRRDLLRLSAAELRRVRGNDVAMIFQEPMSSLNPVYTVASQLTEAIRLHQRLGGRATRAAALDLVRSLGVPSPESFLERYPHQLSGGMRQRVMIAIALSCRPSLLIADEPTTALDVTIQAQILALLKKLQSETGMALVFITHNLGVVAEIADRVAVLYAGKVVESGPVETVFRAPRMPYTAALLRSLPRLGQARLPGGRLAAIPGNVPSPLTPPPGCAFHPRCRHAEAGRCDRAAPELEACGPDHLTRCLRWREIPPERM